MSRCSILRRVTVIGNVTVSAKSKFLVVALENVAMLHSPKVLRNWVTLQSLLKQNFSSLPSRMSQCSILSRGYLRGSPLDTPFVSFLVKGKIPRCGARSSTKGRFAEILVRSKVSNFSLLPHNKVTSNFLLCGVTHPAPAPTFLCKESRQRYTRNLLVP